MYNTVRFGAQFSVWGSSAQLADAQQILKETAQQQGLALAFGESRTLGSLPVFTGPDADRFKLAEAQYGENETPFDMNRDFYRPAERSVKHANRDFSTTHTDYVLTSGKAKFDLLSLEPLPAEAPVEGQQ